MMPTVVKLKPQPQKGWKSCHVLSVACDDIGTVLGRSRILGISDTAISRQQCTVIANQAGSVEVVTSKGIYWQRKGSEKEVLLVSKRQQLRAGDNLWLHKKANQLLYGFEVLISGQVGPATPPAKPILPKRSRERAGDPTSCKRLCTEPPPSGSGIFAGLHLVFWFKSHMKQAMTRAQAEGAVIQPEVDARTTHVIAKQCISPKDALARLQLPEQASEQPGKSPLPENITFLTPDWVSQCLAQQTLLPVDRYLVAIQRSYAVWEKACGPSAEEGNNAEEPEDKQEAIGAESGSKDSSSSASMTSEPKEAASTDGMEQMTQSKDGEERSTSAGGAGRPSQVEHGEQVTGGDSGLPWGSGGVFVEPWDKGAAADTLRKLFAHWHRLDLKEQADAGGEDDKTGSASLSPAESIELVPSPTNGVCRHVACAKAAVCLVEALQTLSQTYGRAGTDSFRRKAADRAIRTLTAADKPLASEADVQALELGEKTRAKVMELITTGQLRRMEMYKGSELHRTLQQFSQVWGCAESTAEKWWTDGCRTLEDVSKRHDLTEQQTAGLKYFEDLKVRIPREEVEQVAAAVEAAALDLFGWGSAPQHDRPHIRCTGSYLRGKPATGDVDMLLIPPSSEAHSCGHILQTLLTHLNQQGLLLDDMGPCRERMSTEGSSSFMGFCRLPGFPHVRRFDIKCYPRRTIACAVNYFTGSGEFNRALRLWAQNSAVACAAAQKLVPSANGFKLSDTVLVPRMITGTVARGDRVEHEMGPPVKVSCETDIFRALGLNYVPPHRRFFHNFQ